MALVVFRGEFKFLFMSVSMLSDSLAQSSYINIEQFTRRDHGFYLEWVVSQRFFCMCLFSFLLTVRKVSLGYPLYFSFD